VSLQDPHRVVEAGWTNFDEDSEHVLRCLPEYDEAQVAALIGTGAVGMPSSWDHE
jgi:hypothetical protein